MQRWTRKDIDDKLDQTRSTHDLWPVNDIPRRCFLKYHCRHKVADAYPCDTCNSYRQECKFRDNALWRPIAYTWQLEYMTQHDIQRLRSFLNIRQILVNSNYVSERP